jgi:SAM-dependent methyltransferase
MVNTTPTAEIAATEHGHVHFRCNICGGSGATRPQEIGRERASCKRCGSTVRWRSVIHALSLELFGESFALPDFPVRHDIKGIGMTDWDGYAVPLAQKLGYTNTYYHAEPRLDILAPPPEMEGTLDFIISSDVFEHIPPPVSIAFDNLRRLLKPGGVVIFSVPWGPHGRTVEHFPDLYEWRIELDNGVRTLINRSRSGAVQTFDKLVFHGGPGSTLEMRQFSQLSLMEEFERAGLGNVQIYNESCPEFGIFWDEDWSSPMSARVPSHLSKLSVPIRGRLEEAGTRPAKQIISEGRINNSPDTNASWQVAVATILEHAEKDEYVDQVARLLAKLMPRYAWSPYYEQYFQLWENHGFHLTPVYFYQPIPDSRQIPNELWEQESELPGVDMNDAMQLRFLTEVFPQYKSEYSQFPNAPTGSPNEFYFENPMFSGTDALALYGMLRHFKPGRVLEVGSGFSSRVTAKAMLANGSGELTCIEPYPQEVLRQGFPGLKQLIEKGVQQVDLDVFQELEQSDVLFIDSSHVVRVGGDVDFLFLEVLPRLRPGVIVHVHDIYLPLPGRRDWVMEERRFWNEQQLLQAFLICNDDFEVLFANAYANRKFPDQLKAAFPSSPWWGGGSFWMRRRLS